MAVACDNRPEPAQIARSVAAGAFVDSPAVHAARISQMNAAQPSRVFPAKSQTGLIILLTILFLMFPAVLLLVSKPIAIVLALAIVGGAGWLIATAKRVKIEISAEGITHYRRRSTTTLRWDDLSHYRFWSSKQQANAGGQGGLIAVAVIAAVQAAKRRGQEPNRNFELGFLKLFSRHGGPQVTVTPNIIGAPELMELVFAEMHPRLAQRAQFGEFTLNGQTLVHKKKGPIELAEIEHMSVGGFNLSVKKRDKRLMWVNTNMSKLDNSMLLLEQLAAAGVVVKASHEVFVPRPVLSLFHQVAARHAALPQARVHVK